MTIMPEKEYILSVLHSLKPELQEQFGVESLALAGSVLRGEVHPESDIDILVSLKYPTFDNLVGIQETLEQHLKNRIDLIRDGAHLGESFRQTLVREAVYV
jgi:predicted nucleotidyltransferase